MFKFIKSLFSNDDLIKTGVNALINTGDVLCYTAEEKAQAKAKQQDWYLELMKAASPSARSRRGVAWSIMFIVTLLTIIAVICQLTDNTKNAEWILKLLNDVWAWPFVAVVGFYFGPMLIPKGK